MIRRLLTASLFLMAIVASAPLWFPAQLIWHLADPRLPAGLVIHEIGGTAVDGWARCALVEGIDSRIDWGLDPLGLWQGHLLAVLHVKGAEHELQGEIRLVDGRLTGDRLQGQLGRGVLKPLLAPYGVDAQGSLIIERAAFAIETLEAAWPTSLAADLRWPGGTIEYLGAAGAETYAVPLIQGRLGLQGPNLLLQLKDNSARALLDLLLTREGWLTTRVYGQLLALIGQSLPPDMNPAEIVFEVEQAVMLPGGAAAGVVPPANN